MLAATDFPRRTANRNLRTAADRWVGVGPYYAMFPVSFAYHVIRNFSSRGDAVLDPFAGRGTGVFAAATSGRSSVGIEINPVGWLYSNVKLRPAAQRHVIERLDDIRELASSDAWSDDLDALPDFYRWCFSRRVRQFLLCARDVLRWRESRIDATVMAFILTYLHGKHGAALSNQMRDGKSMSPDYAVNWWRERGLRPPAIDPVAFLKQRVMWRYRKGTPAPCSARVALGNCISVLARLRYEVAKGRQDRFRLLFTSPPYRGVTNYHYDQWLRLWMLGQDSRPRRVHGSWTRKFQSRTDYVELLDQTFERCSAVMTRDAIVYVRTDARQFTLETTMECLRAHFSRHRMRLYRRPFGWGTQTALLGDRTTKPGEVDIILRR